MMKKAVWMTAVLAGVFAAGPVSALAAALSGDEACA
jgi:hypothetical protein